MHCRWLRFIICLTLLVQIALTGCQRGNQGQKSYTIGIININSTLTVMVKGFKAGLAEKGCVEGKNTTYLYEDRLLTQEEVPAALQALVSNKTDLIYVLSTPAARQTALVLKGENIPILFSGVYDPVQTGLLKNPQAPEGNITGIQIGGGTDKALEWLLRVRPEIKKVYVPFDDNDKAAKQSLQNMKEGAEKLRLELLPQKAGSAAELVESLSSIPTAADAIFILNGVTNASHIETFVAAAERYQLPLAGGLGFTHGVPIFFGPDRFAIGRQASRMAYNILQGTPVSMIPVENAELFLRINLKTAQTTGLKISNNILSLADEIIR